MHCIACWLHVPCVVAHGPGSKARSILVQHTVPRRLHCASSGFYGGQQSKVRSSSYSPLWERHKDKHRHLLGNACTQRERHAFLAPCSMCGIFDWCRDLFCVFSYLLYNFWFIVFCCRGYRFNCNGHSAFATRPCCCCCCCCYFIGL